MILNQNFWYKQIYIDAIKVWLSDSKIIKMFSKISNFPDWKPKISGILIESLLLKFLDRLEMILQNVSEFSEKIDPNIRSIRHFQQKIFWESSNLAIC